MELSTPAPSIESACGNSLCSSATNSYFPRGKVCCDNSIETLVSVAVTIVEAAAGGGDVAVVGSSGGRSRYLNRAAAKPGIGETQPTPEQLLAERFARGEIDEEEYWRRLDTLGGAGPVARA
jgi:putative membrane protein